MSIGVSVLHEDPAVLDDVAYAVGRCDGIHLAALGEVRGDGVVLASAGELARARNGAGLVVLSTGDPLADARAGFAAGARGLLRWPDDAAVLAVVVAAAALGSTPAEPGGRVVSVSGARGGAGTTTVACLLAAAIEGAVLVDLSGGGQLAFAPDEAGGSLERALASPLPDVILRLCEPHASGRALLPVIGAAPRSPESAETLLEAARRVAPVVVIDCGRLQPRPGDRLLLVCAADVASLREAREWPGEPAIVLNGRRRGGLRANHVEKALGRPPVAVMPQERRLARAADIGSLPRRPGRKVRRFVRMLREEVGL